MNINPSLSNQKKSQTIINKAGGISYEENPLRHFLLSLLSLNTRRTKSFYHTEDESFAEFLKVARITLDNDFEFAVATSAYMSQLGRRIAPTILLTEAAIKASNETEKNIIHKASKLIFDRPDKITTSLAHFYNETGLSIKKAPRFFKRDMAKALTVFEPITLKKFRAEKKLVSLSDAIRVCQVLQLKLSSEKREMFKSIIEKRKEAKLQKEEHITAMLSSVNTTKEEKKTFMADNVKKIPLKALITNLKQYIDIPEAHQDIINRFDDILKNFDNPKVQKIFNITDLFIPEDSLRVPGIKTELFEVIDSILSKAVQKYSFAFDVTKKYKVLQDLSGSMYAWNTVSNRIYDSAKMLTILFSLVPVENISIILFDTKNENHTEAFAKIAQLHKGKPLSLYNNLVKHMNEINNFRGNTCVVDTYIKTVDASDDIVILNTDEMTWADNNSVVQMQKHISSIKSYTQTIILNVAYTDGKVLANKGVIRLAGLSKFSFDMIGVMTGDMFKIKEKIMCEWEKK